jgi:LysM repeat protein
MPQKTFTLRGPDDPGGVSALLLPSAPTEFSVASSPSFTSVAIDGLGEVKLPNGRSSTVYSWSSVFYGYARVALSPLISNWREPVDIVAQVDNWIDQQVKRQSVLNLTVTDSNVNKDVWISNWSYKATGGFGDIAYTLELTEARPIFINVDGDAAGDGNGSVSSEGPTPDDGGETAPTPSTYIVAEGDYLIKIAKNVYGDSSKWRDIYEANKELIGSNPDALKPGMNLTIPGGTPADVEPTTDELNPEG